MTDKELNANNQFYVFEHDTRTGVYYSSIAPGYETTDLNVAFMGQTKYQKPEAFLTNIPKQFYNIVEVKRATNMDAFCVSKWMVSHVRKTTSGEEIQLSPIQDVQNDEDRNFTKFTPSGTQTFFLCNPALIGKYTPGMVIEQHHLIQEWVIVPIPLVPEEE